MCRHHRIHSRRNCFLERRQIDGAQVLQIVVHHGDGKVRVGCGIAVPWEMLCGSQHSIGSRAADVSGHEIAHLVGVAPERARPDDGVRGIGIHVGDGKQIPVHPQGPALLRCNASELLCIFQVPGRSKSHRMREHRRSKEVRRKNPALEVPSDQQRQVRFLLQLIQQRNRLKPAVHIACPPLRRDRHGQRADVIFTNIVTELDVIGTLSMQKFHPHPDHEQLPDLLLD